MSNVIQLDDGFGGRIGDRSPMPAKPGAHVVYARGPDLVVEWYDYGDHAPYESANLLVFDRETQIKLARLIGADESLAPHWLSNEVAARFDSYFDVQSFAQEHGLPFTKETDFWP